MEDYFTVLKHNNFTDYVYDSLNEDLQVVLYSLLAFCVPFFLSHPQFLVGSVVNMMLVLGAQNLKGTKLFAMIFMPSLGVVASGLIFGGLTKYLIYFLPMIWVGNMCLVYGYKFFRSYFKLNKFNSLGVGIVLKVLLLSLTAWVLVFLGFVPEMFLYAMGVVQFGTALAGGVSALIVSKFILSRFVKN